MEAISTSLFFLGVFLCLAYAFGPRFVRFSLVTAGSILCAPFIGLFFLLFCLFGIPIVCFVELDRLKLSQLFLYAGGSLLVWMMTIPAYVLFTIVGVVKAFRYLSSRYPKKSTANAIPTT